MCFSDTVCRFIVLNFNFCVHFVREMTAAVAENGCAAAIGVKISFGTVCD